MNHPYYTVILQELTTGRIASVITYVNEVEAVADYVNAVVEEPETQATLWLNEKPGEPAIKLTPVLPPEAPSCRVH